MPWRGIIITGTSGAGKSTLTNMLRAHYPRFEQMRALTTRPPREGDEPDFYEHLSASEFERRRCDLVIWAEYRGQKYGIARADIAAVEGRGSVPVLVITPRSLAEYLARNPEGQPFLTVFVDAPDDELDARLKVRDGDIKKASVSDQRVEDRKHRTHNVIINTELDTAFGQLLDLWVRGPG